MGRSRRNTGALRTSALALALAASLVAVAACGSSSKSSSGGSSGGSSSGGSSSQVSAAQKITDQNKVAPTKIRLSTPLKKKPGAGSFVWLSCDINQCKDEGDGLREATAAIGWKYSELNYKSADPATLVAAMKQALTMHPTAVGLSGLPEAVWSSVLPAYKKAGVKIVVNYLGPTPLDDTVLGNIGGPSDVKEYGQIIANWFIADSKGKGQALLLSVNDFPILKVFSDSFKDTVKSGCSGCKVTELNATIPQVTGGKTVGAITSSLQSKPNIGYVITCNGPFVTGLSSALAAAGKSKVKIAGESGDVGNLTNVKSGKEAAYTGLALHYGSWLQIDSVLRSLQGDTVPEGDGGLPKQLLTKDVDFAISNSYDKPADFRDQFKKLWLVG